MVDAEQVSTLLRYKTRDKYLILKQISKGAYGDVFLAERLEDGKQVCLKQVDLDFLSPSEREGCLSEVRLLQSLPTHRNVVKFYDAFWEDTSDCGGGSRLVVVLEYGDTGDLEGFIHSEHLHPHAMATDTALDVFAQIVSGLAFLHQQHVLHRDIKSKNVFRFSDGRVVIGDFGTSKALAHTAALANTLVGSPLYMSPEVLNDQPYSFSSDMWSLGCLLYELFSGQTPFNAPSYPAVVFKITKGEYTPLPPTVPVDVRELVARLLTLDPSQRPTAEELLGMEIVQSRLCATITANDVPDTTLCRALPPDSVALTGLEKTGGVCEHRVKSRDNETMLLPPPPPSTTMNPPLTSHDTQGLPSPPKPNIPRKVNQTARRDTSQVFPTPRATIADILSKERLSVHRERVRQATPHPTGANLLSCVPVLETARATALPIRRAPKATKKNTLATNPRSPIPAENMLIIGTKVNSVKPTVSTTSKPKH